MPGQAGLAVRSNMLTRERTRKATMDWAQEIEAQRRAPAGWR